MTTDRILVVDGDESAVDALEDALRSAGLEPMSALDNVTALKLFDELRPSVVLIGVRPYGPDARGLVRALRLRSADVPVLFMGHGVDADTIKSPSEALDAGGDYYFRLPTDLGYLAGRVRGWTQGNVVPPPSDERHDDLHSLSAELDGDLDLEGFNDAKPADRENAALAVLRARSGAPSAPPPSSPPDRVRALSGPPPPPRDGPSADPAPAVAPPWPRRPSGSVDTARALVREAEALRNQGRVPEALEAYHSAASMYAQDGEVRPALALYKLLLYLDAARVETAYDGALFAVRHGQLADARAMLERATAALEQSQRPVEALDLIARFTEHAGPNPDLSSIAQRLEAALIQPPAPIEGAATTRTSFESPERAPSVPAILPGPMQFPPEAEEAGQWGMSSLDLLGLEGRPSDDLYPDERELRRPRTRDIHPAAPLRSAQDTEVQAPMAFDDVIIEAPVEADGAMVDIELPVPEPVPAAPRPDRRNRRGRAPLPDPSTLGLEPLPAIVVERAAVSPFAFPSIDGPDSGAGTVAEAPRPLAPADSELAEPAPDTHAELAPPREDAGRAARAPEPPAPDDEDATIEPSAPIDPWPFDDELASEGQTEEVDISEIAELSAIQAERRYETDGPVLQVPRTRPARPLEGPLLSGSDPGPASLFAPSEERIALPIPSEAPALPPQAPSFTQGTLTDLQDAIEVLGELYAIGATGVLHARSGLLVIASGQPAGLRGDNACQALIAEAQRNRPVPLEALPDQMETIGSSAALARHLVMQRVITETESAALLHNQLEAGLKQWLRTVGPWQFQPAEVVRSELIEPVPDVRRTLIDILDAPNAIPVDPTLIVRCGTLAPSLLAGRDDRFSALLDGYRTMGEAARVAGLPLSRAAAVAVVLLGFRLAVVTGRSVDGETPSLQAEALGVAAPASARPTTSAPGPDAHLRALAEMVRTSDYFTMLGVDTEASPTDVDQAHQRLRALVPGTAAGRDPTHRTLAKEIIRSLDQARDVLRVPELRAAYLRHLHR